MTSIDSGLPNQLRREPLTGRVFGPVQWAPVIAGAIAAAALAFVLHSVAIGMGLSAGSAAPSWRDTSFALVLLSALYLVLAAIASYGFGGYVFGLQREPMTAPPRRGRIQGRVASWAATITSSAARAQGARGSDFQGALIQAVMYPAAPTGIISFALMLWGNRIIRRISIQVA